MIHPVISGNNGGGLNNGFWVGNWAGGGLTASVRESMNCCRLGRSERLALAANNPGS